MTSLTLGIAVVLLAVSIAILGTLTFFIFKPTKELLLRSQVNSLLTKKVILLQKIDILVEQENPLEAINVLPHIPFLEIPRSAETLSGIRDINQAFLSKVLMISEKLGSRITNLEKLEALILERHELSQLLFKAKFSYETLVGKRENDGKALPSWTKNEFNKKESEILTALDNNLRLLKDEVEIMVLNLKQSSSGEFLIH